MRIAVIGAGNVGAGFSRAAVAAGHDVVVSAAHPEKAQALASEIGARSAASNAEAAQGAQVVLLAVPAAEAPAVTAEVVPAAPGAVVVDATNPLNATFDGLAIEGTSGAEAVQRAAGSTPVVKAFNTVFASRYAAPAEQGSPLTVLVAGDDAAARGTVAELATSLGFAPVEAPSLRFARTLEELGFLNIALNAGNGWAWQNHFQVVGPTSV
ncbi:MAG TPA: NAD(P)-binding domain-containing protein [Blastococcus sp.]|nr:NAD(P)-binding domain-containing protein [Blastococcus sp.]